PALVAPSSHRTDVDAGIEEVVGEPDPVTEQRAAREGARGVDRDDPDCRSGRAHVRDERGDERGFPHTRRSRDPYHGRLPRLRIEIAHERIAERVPVLHESDRARKSTLLPCAHACGQLLERPPLSRQGEPLYAAHLRGSLVLSAVKTFLAGRARTEQAKDAGSAHIRRIWARPRTPACDGSQPAGLGVFAAAST